MIPILKFWACTIPTLLHVPAAVLPSQDFNKPVGVYSQTVFVPGSTRALTGTSEGCGVVWQDLKEGTIPHDVYTTECIKNQGRGRPSIITAVTAKSPACTINSTSGDMCAAIPRHCGL